ncbi:SH3 domain-containing protein [Pseudorhizobium marinum]|uniref:SH3 domain-containing protein n=1 Tax=Pseudorhizobium marinum TaxID=1496690 RepID=UPI001AEC6B06|nr:SH3 domain-containing protein [Pseudorhizobium marinum]
MSKQGRLGWIVAGVLAVAWLGSRVERDVPEVQPPPASLMSHPAEPVPGIFPPAPPPARLPAHDPTPRVPAFPSQQPERLYATANVRLRAGPSTSAAIVWTVPKGEAVLSRGRDGEWHEVSALSHDGWIRGDFLSRSRPAIQEEPAVRYAPAAPFVRQVPARPSGSPLRDPYIGTCDCPYDLMRNGRRCGGRSAYDRPGGRSPQCYF